MSTALKNRITKRDHISGDRTAALVLLEYGDYQCPSCGDSYRAVNKSIRQLGKNIVFVFRNFPLTDIHPDAFDAALAAEAAALQNKFWEMYAQLCQNQAYLNEQERFSYAKRIGLDMDRFGKDIQSQALASKIENDIESGIKSGISGTPSFYVNGGKFDGEWEGEGLVQYLNGLL
jgi:protein-disulfide isomerase